MLRITIDTQTYDFDPNKLTNKEAKVIEQFSGQRISAFQDNEMKTSDADQMTTVVWLCRKRAGETDLKIDDVEFDMGAVQVVDLDDPTDSPLPDDPKGMAVDPTPGQSSESGPVTG